MRGRKGIAEFLARKEFVRMYTSGMTFEEIGEEIGAKAESVRAYFLENFLGFERFKLKDEHIKNANGGENS